MMNHLHLIHLILQNIQMNVRQINYLWIAKIILILNYIQILYMYLLNMYPSLYEAAKGHIVPAILGQVLYFVSGILLVILLKFRGEKKQFLFNVFYAVEFFALTIPATALFGLEGFVFSSLVANAIRFVAVLLWGFGTSKKASV